MTMSRITLPLVAVAALAVHAPIGAQEQPSKPRAAWPCGGRLDPAYFQGAEATGGHLLMLAPGEIGDSAGLFMAFMDNPQTIFRLAGPMNPGLHEFHVPIDASVESVVFSISVQCLQTAEVARPSGAIAGGPGVTDLANFLAVRMVIVKQPDPGVWTIRVSGSGVAGVMVQARTALAIAEVQFAAIGSTDFTSSPSAGVENAVRIRMSGHPTQIEASLVNASFKRIAALPLTAGETENSYVSRFTPGKDAFRVLIEGKDADGVRFQRVLAPLFTP
jgi:hypothetical protein